MLQFDSEARVRESSSLPQSMRELSIMSRRQVRSQGKLFTRRPSCINEDTKLKEEEERRKELLKYKLALVKRSHDPQTKLS